MSQYIFGSGTLFGRRTDVANPTPVKFGVLQDVSVEFSAAKKELFGENQFAVAVARGTAKIECKAKFGRISGRAFAELFFGGTLTAGKLALANGESASIPATTPFTVTVANAAGFAADLGVIVAATGLPMTRVASAPATGQYSVDEETGIYTFAEADASVAVAISYRYAVADSGQKFTITNQPLGVQPVFEVVLESKYNQGRMIVVLNACTSTKLSLPSKQEDFTIPELDFSAMADDAGNVGTMSFSELS